MRSVLRFVFRTIAIFVLCSAAVPLTVAVIVLASFIFLPLPATLPEAREVEAGMVSRVYDQNGTEIGQFREFEQSIPVLPTDIPLHLKQAVIAQEDRNFYQHGGVDVRGTMRALYTDVRGGTVSQGGSTITQQYVKNTYVGKERTLSRKVREAVVASQLDRQVDKDEILFKYLDTVSLGEGAYGVGAASETYFRKRVNDLTLSEAATLAGMIPAPSRYSARDFPSAAENKRRLVLASMLSEGYITQPQHDEAAAQGIIVEAGPRPGPEVPHTFVYQAQSPPTAYPYFLDYVEKYLKGKYGAEKVDTGGLRIQTTLDPRVQAEAERSVAEAIKGAGPATITRGERQGQPTPLEMSLVAVEPQTGFVKAFIGGRDFNAPDPGAKVNLGLGGCYRPPDGVPVEVEATCWPLAVEGQYPQSGGTGRQPGSSFKPFVLAAAFEKGVLPSKVYPAPNSYRIPDCRPTPNFDCTIGNYEGASFGSSDLRKATHSSINTVYAQLVRDVGCKETGEMAKKLGVTSAWYSPQVHTCSGSYALGTLDVSPLEMASAYAVFANRGLRQDSTPIVRVEDRDGTVLEDNRRREATRVIDEVVADNVTDIMKGVITGGTGKNANIGRPAAGKTGTSQASRNSWFVGYTPTLSTAIWVGYRDEPIPMRSVRGCAPMTGGCLPAKTWKAFMSPALEGVPSTEFNEPAPIKVITDRISRAARTGIDPGDQRRPSSTGIGGPYIVGPAMPKADAPPAPTPTTAPAAATPTTTTRAGGTGSTTTTTRPGNILDP
ncbi:MAG TPA: transglycosylase domain-containing protein [Acidimicrobiales bacterium]|nr:transglycosylase domain-containing protein [Acidimicrobiales bacterium]